jgi:hypothetical protein
MDATHEFVRDLLLQVPDLQPLYKEHVEDNDELLPHVFMGDVTRFIVALNADSLSEGPDSTASERTLTKALDFLEQGMHKADKVRELVAVSFLENLDQSDENYPSLKSHLGKSLLEQLAKYEG